MAIGPAHPETSLVFDNDVFTHLRNEHEYVLREIGQYVSILKQPPALTSITIFEALYGIESEEAKERITAKVAQDYRNKINDLTKIYTVLPFDQNAATIAAYTYARLTSSEQKMHQKDLFIAATALSHGYGVVTQNRRDFEIIANKLPDNLVLRIAIWKR